MTAEAHDREPTLAERVDYTRQHVPPEQREAYETALREATRQALDSGDYGSLDEVVEQWYRAAFLEHHGGESWQRTQRLIKEGRWDELAPGPDRSFDEVIEELLR